MTTLEVAYGLPEAEVLPALRAVTENFDESPPRMHAVLGPPGRGLRWFAFACSSLGPGRVLAQDHFRDSIDRERLVVVVRSHAGPPLMARGGAWTIDRDATTVRVRGAALPPGARRDGDVDEILLSALGLDTAIRPFDALAAPTHEVVLREDRVRLRKLAIAPFTGPVLPTRVEPRADARGEIVESFALGPRAVGADRGALEAHLAKVSATVEGAWVQQFDRELDKHVAELVRVGPAIAQVLIAFLGEAGNKTRTARVALAGLAALGAGEGAEAMIAWATKPSELPQQAGYAALVALGEAARPALLAAREAKRPRVRAVGEAVLEILDGDAWAPLRGARGGKLYGWIEDPSTRSLDDATTDDWWGVARHFVDRPREWWQRYRWIASAAAHSKGLFAPIADQLLRYPPFTDDVLLSYLARGEPLPPIHDIHAMARKTGMRGGKLPRSKPKAKAKAKTKAKPSPRPSR